MSQNTHFRISEYVDVVSGLKLKQNILTGFSLKQDYK